MEYKKKGSDGQRRNMKEGSVEEVAFFLSLEGRGWNKFRGKNKRVREASVSKHIKP